MTQELVANMRGGRGSPHPAQGSALGGKGIDLSASRPPRCDNYPTREVEIGRQREHGSTTTDRLASMAHESIDRVTPKANRAETEMRDTAARTAEGVKHLEEQALDTAKDGLRNAQAYIEEKPLMSAGIAFAAGALLSMLIRR